MTRSRKSISTLVHVFLINFHECDKVLYSCVVCQLLELSCRLTWRNEVAVFRMRTMPTLYPDCAASNRSRPSSCVVLACKHPSLQSEGQEGSHIKSVNATFGKDITVCLTKDSLAEGSREPKKWLCFIIMIIGCTVHASSPKNH